MIGEGVSPLTIDSPDTDCHARSFACAWCPFRDYCEKKLMDTWTNCGGVVMRLKRLKCILTGGCKFDMEQPECHYDAETDMDTIKLTCVNCGKVHVYKFNRTAAEKYAEQIHYWTL